MSEENNKLQNPFQIVKDDGHTTFFSDGNYIIPIYQRAFSWTDTELKKLIEDINGFDESNKQYYLGSLIVDKNEDGSFSVIDGQQRLTALYLLLSVLGYNMKNDALSYECREKSNYTLKRLKEYTDTDKNFDDNIICKAESLNTYLQKIDLNIFKEKLKKVVICRIEVPPHTDLNRYFETMNTRGEQLEQHDILKAKFMEPFKDDKQLQRCFALVWDACRNMKGYIQMHFSPENRANIFGNNWNCIPNRKLNINANLDNVDAKTVFKIINDNKLGKNLDKQNRHTNDDDEEESPSRFISSIDFPHFLLHVLRVFVVYELKDLNEIALSKIKNALPDQYDDRKLLETFNSSFDIIKNSEIISLQEVSKRFEYCLLKCRFLFDKYIIKRDHKDDVKKKDNSGVWSIKELAVYDKKPNYTDTSFKNKKAHNKTYDLIKAERHKKNLMLQSCLRVSFTSPKSMQWITDLLLWLYDDENTSNLSNLENITENIAKEKVKEIKEIQDWIENDVYLNIGTKTPHIVFNYLDYLLWTKRDEDMYKEYHFKDFIFEYRNSVEHWYPQNPPKDSSLTLWDEKNRFGNLCIIQRDVNSKFSNLGPKEKKELYAERIQKGSLKLRLMSEKTNDDVDWQTSFKQHEEEMREILKANLNLIN